MGGALTYVVFMQTGGNVYVECSPNMVSISPLKNRDWRRSSWTFNWKSLYKKFRRPREATCELGHWTSGITLFPIVFSLSPVYYNFQSYDILPEFIEYSDRCQSAQPGIKWRWAPCCHAYYVTQLWRHQRVPWHNCLCLTTTGRVANDASWS